MRYLELTPGRASLRQGPEPELAPGDARVRVLACGVCGTDLHLLRGMVLPPGVSYPVRPGHEVAGIVEEVRAPDVRARPADARARSAEARVPPPDARARSAEARVRPGDLVILHLLAPCGDCAACRSGEEQRCARAQVLGIHRPGGLSEIVVWPAARMVSATGIAPATAALLADAAATGYHAFRIAGVPEGGTLCVIGAGGLGTSVLAIARALDPTVRLAAIVRHEATAARVSSHGVEVHHGLANAARTLRRSFGRADAVIDFSGDAAAPAEGAALLRRGGRLVLGSVVDDDLVLGPSSAFMTQELQVHGAYSSSMADLEAVVELVRSGRLDADAWVTHRRPLSDAVGALELAASHPPGMVRVVVEAESR